ncbi:Sugar-specific transcriptional regulator TrmB [Brevinema andersonii]|uniref:Sugar-specific transcriptional regulator TrmB n=1 Tax=Brevinema andersonii TaxID=34097 RepID=A0A1I1ES13_BREAD|nr:helix-turn-helix domain-containing protein [Brevinema andersonii]SFB87693.1 Sugar-specific transcriptional regulator TrmB [Brevinema andersonii]
MVNQDPNFFVNRFEELGLSRNEALVYVALLKNHPVTGYKLAKDSGILRPVVYEMLARLAEKGGVRIVKSNPEQYSPISPDSFLSSLERRFTDAKYSLIEDLKQYQNEDEEVENDDFWNIIGRDTILSNIQEMIEKAKKNIFFYVNNCLYTKPLIDVLSKKVASGIKVIGFSYRSIIVPGAEIYSFMIKDSIVYNFIPDDRILFSIDQKYSIIADMDEGKASQSMRPVQVETTTDFIKMKISLYRLMQVMDSTKLSLYLFEEDKKILDILKAQD